MFSAEWLWISKKYKDKGLVLNLKNEKTAALWLAPHPITDIRLFGFVWVVGYSFWLIFVSLTNYFVVYNFIRTDIEDGCFLYILVNENRLMLIYTDYIPCFLCLRSQIGLSLLHLLTFYAFLEISQGKGNNLGSEAVYLPWLEIRIQQIKQW